MNLCQNAVFFKDRDGKCLYKYFKPSSSNVKNLSQSNVSNHPSSPRPISSPNTSSSNIRQSLQGSASSCTTVTSDMSDCSNEPQQTNSCPGLLCEGPMSGNVKDSGYESQPCYTPGGYKQCDFLPCSLPACDIVIPPALPKCDKMPKNIVACGIPPCPIKPCGAPCGCSSSTPPSHEEPCRTFTCDSCEPSNGPQPCVPPPSCATCIPSLCSGVCGPMFCLSPRGSLPCPSAFGPLPCNVPCSAMCGPSSCCESAPCWIPPCYLSCEPSSCFTPCSFSCGSPSGYPCSAYPYGLPPCGTAPCGLLANGEPPCGASCSGPPYGVPPCKPATPKPCGLPCGTLGDTPCETPCGTFFYYSCCKSPSCEAPNEYPLLCESPCVVTSDFPKPPCNYPCPQSACSSPCEYPPDCNSPCPPIPCNPYPCGFSLDPVPCGENQCIPKPCKKKCGNPVCKDILFCGYPTDLNSENPCSSSGGPVSCMNIKREKISPAKPAKKDKELTDRTKRSKSGNVGKKK